MRKILCLVIISLFFFSSIFPAIAYVNNNDNWIQSQKLIVSGDEDDLPNILWSKIYGNGRANSVQQTSDGGYILCGSYGDAILIKTDKDGNSEWIKNFGGEYEDWGLDAIECSDGGFLCTGGDGYTPSHGLKQVFLVKTDVNSNELWFKTFRKQGRDGSCWGESVIEVIDGYVILAQLGTWGVTEEGAVWLIKTDLNGNEIWNRTFEGKSPDQGICLIQAKDGGFVFTGTTYSYDIGGGDAWLLKTDNEGNELWNKSYGGKSYDTGQDVIQTDDGGYMIAGRYTPAYESWADVGLFKTDSSGNLEWIKHYGGGDQDSGYSVAMTDDGGYIVVGIRHSGLPSFQGWMLKTDGNGNKLWDKVIDGRPHKIIKSNDGNYVVAGGDSEIWLLKIEDFENNIPSKPTIVYDKNSFQLKVTSIDPDGDRIRYGISWYNNKVVDDWTEYYDSGVEGSILCLGKDKPASLVAEDKHGGQSEWVTAKIKTKTFNPLLQLLERLFEWLLYYLSFVSVGGGY